jgi:hypothetical protein
MIDPFVEAASWALTAELFRRFPGQYFVSETHPCSGQYDCLSVIKIQTREHIFDFNRSGSIHVMRQVFGTSKHEPINWDQLGEEQGLRRTLDEISERAGLTIPDYLPSSTSDTVTIRVIAFMARCFLFEKKYLSFRQHCADYYFYPMDPSTIPGWDQFNRQTQSDDGPWELQYWFLWDRCTAPLAAIHVSGQALRNDGRTFNFAESYRSQKRIHMVALDFFGPFLS